MPPVFSFSAYKFYADKIFQEEEKMKKKMMAMLTAAVLAVTMLAGCGNAKKDYESDMAVLEQAANYIDETDLDSGDSFVGKLNGLSCKTAEGKAMLADFVTMGGLYDQMQAEMAKDDYDMDALNKIMEDMTALQDTFTEHTKAFEEAAKAVGVDASKFESEMESEEE